MLCCHKKTNIKKMCLDYKIFTLEDDYLDSP